MTREAVVTNRTARGGSFSRRTLIAAVANAMVIIAFALGYFIHP
jgi:hypothetical protein